MKVRIVDRSPPPRAPEDPRRVVRLYRDLWSVDAVARELERGSQYIRDILRKQGVELRNLGTRDPKTRGLYAAWRNMIRRCDDPGHCSYPNYGARSVGYAASWAEFPAFRAWALSHGWRSGTSLLLHNPVGDHTPANCYWGTHAQMLQLRSRVKPLTEHPIRAFGELKSAYAWARDPRCTVTYMGLLRRLRCGWPPQSAITLPRRTRAPQHSVEPRTIKKLGKRVDWTRAVNMRREGRSVAEIAAACRCALSTLYVGLQRRGIEAGQHPARRRIDDGSIYAAWDRMRQICRGKYRGRRDSQAPGMDPAWRSYEAFRAWARSHGYRSGLCLIRIDTTRPYRPSNCRFVDRSEITSDPEAHPTPLGTPRYLIRALGSSKGLVEWSRDARCTVTAVTIRRRLLAGWRADDAITVPPMKPGSTGHANRLVTAFGETKGIVEWTRDRRCRVGISGLGRRLDNGMPPERAITLGPYAPPGRGQG